MSPSSSRLRKLRYTGFALALAVLAAVGAATIWSIDRALTSFDWVEHTYRVMSTIQDYRAEIRSAESSARGYRLTGRTALRDDLLGKIPTINMRLAELVAQVADNPQQSARARQLRMLTDQRLALSRQLAQPEAPAHEQQIIAKGIEAMSGSERLSAQMLHVERMLLAERRTRSADEMQLLIGFIGSGMAFAILLLALVMRGLQRESKRSLCLEAEARDAMVSLHDSMAHLAHISEQRGVLSRYASLLQSCQDVPEALQVTGHVLAELLPAAGGRCYLLRASQDLAESAAVFGTPAASSAELLQPLQCWALRKGQPYRVDHLGGGIVCAHIDASAVGAAAWSICVPLLAQGNALGLIHASGKNSEDREQAQAVLETVAEQLGLALVNLQLRDTLRVQSLRDSLTGLFNRRYLDESLQREITRCDRRGLPLAVMMLDIDHFKIFNDTNGHAAGDALLARIGQVLQTMTRNEDLACRYGGEEFTLVLPEVSQVCAMRRAEEIRAAIGATTVQHLRQTLGPCTASIGVAMLPQDGQAPALLLSKADAALYRAKVNGRDRVVAADATSTEAILTAATEPTPP